MTYAIGPGHNHPPGDIEERVRVNIPPIRVPGSENILDYPKKFRTSIEQNEKLLACCREAVKHVCTVYQTPTCQAGFPWDVFIATCCCGRRHIRWLVGEKHEFIKERR